MADKSKKDQTSNDASNKSTGESEKKNTDKQSNKDQTTNDASDKLTDGSEKKNTDENNGLKAQDDSSKDNKSLGLLSNPGVSDEDGAQLQVDSNTQLSEDYQENFKQQYDKYRLTAQTLMYLIDHMDREKVSKWLSRLDEMNDEDGQMERMYYLKYLVSTLSTSFGLEEPFTALPPHTVQKLSQILPPAVFAELLDRNEETAEPLLSRKPFGSQKPVGERRPLIEHHDYNDRLFFEQQLFPPEGLICYAAAFSALPDRSDED